MYGTSNGFCDRTVKRFARLTRGMIVPMIAGPILLWAPVHAAAQSAPGYPGLKKTVSVSQFQAAESVGGGVTSEGMTAMLISALANDGRFVVVERPGTYGDIVGAEQMMAKAGAVDAETAAGTGQMSGASAVIIGVVTKYDPAAKGGGVSLGIMGGGSPFGGNASRKNQKAVIEISLRLVDTTSGQIIANASAQGEASSSITSAGLVEENTGATLGTTSFKSTPIGQAGEDAIKKAVEFIAASMNKVPWSALVIDAADGKIYINAGADRNVLPGMELTAYKKGKVFKDPGTGEVLEVSMDKTGVIRIDEVRDRLSVASLVSGTAPTRGDVLKRD
ncbi:CsgG/HfaB family protein [Emcibacter sp. SYSU 3D8]|uniref:CsgG/HfaB family protein n=1 Tax=Emcibacter sp. SYSU 3D8 TaxID=3133969 RepID=UPI0031FEE414